MVHIDSQGKVYLLCEEESAVIPDHVLRCDWAFVFIPPPHQNILLLWEDLHFRQVGDAQCIVMHSDAQNRVR